MGKIVLYDPEKRCAGLNGALADGDMTESGTLHTFTGKERLIYYLEEVNEDIDILIVSLICQKELGIEVARVCRKKVPHVKLMLVIDKTERPEYYLELRPDCLFVYPFDVHHFRRAVGHLERLVEQEYKRCLTLETKGKIYRIPFQSIQYAESRGHQICLKTWEEEILVYGKLDELLTRLPPYFLHCHKSYVINLNYVRQLEMYRLRLQGKQEWIPVSQRYYKELKNCLIDIA